MEAEQRQTKQMNVKKNKIAKWVMGLGVPIAAATTITLVSIGSFYSYKKNYATKPLDNNLNNEFVQAKNYNSNELYNNNQIKPINEILNFNNNTKEEGLNIFVFKISENMNQSDKAVLKDLVQMSFISNMPSVVYAIKANEAQIFNFDSYKYQSLLQNRILVNKENNKESKVVLTNETTFNGIRGMLEEIKKTILNNRNKKINLWMPANLMYKYTALMELYGYQNVKILGLCNSDIKKEDRNLKTVANNFNNENISSIKNLHGYLAKNEMSYITLSSIYPNIFLFMNNKKNLETIVNEHKLLKKIYSYSSDENYDFDPLIKDIKVKDQDQEIFLEDALEYKQLSSLWWR